MEEWIVLIERVTALGGTAVIVLVFFLLYKGKFRFEREHQREIEEREALKQERDRLLELALKNANYAEKLVQAAEKSSRASGETSQAPSGRR